MQETFDVKEKAKTNFEGFVKILTNLIRDKKIEFDLILGAGNTGIAMAELTEMIFSELNVPVPPKLAIPYLRFTEMHVGEGIPFENNNLLVPEIRDQIKDIKNIKNMLFVDDEIGVGRTAKGVIELLVQAREELSQNKPNLYIVVEDRSYNPQNHLVLNNLVGVQYCPFAEGGPVGNAILHIVPPDIHEAIQTYGNLAPKEEINALLGLPKKDKRGEKPVWSYDQLNHMQQNINNFEELQSKFRLYLRDLIRKAIPTN